MKATELRLGNYLNDNDEEDFKVTPEIIMHIHDGGKHNFKPIPITDNWLECFQFEKLCNRSEGYANTVWSHKKIQMRFHFDDKLLVLKYHMAYFIKYVHELQNLYYALTKEELVLETPPDGYPIRAKLEREQQ